MTKPVLFLDNDFLINIYGEESTVSDIQDWFNNLPEK